MRKGGLWGKAWKRREKGEDLSTPTPVQTETCLRVPTGLRSVEARPMGPGAGSGAQGARRPPFPPPSRQTFKRIKFCN